MAATSFSDRERGRPDLDHLLATARAGEPPPLPPGFASRVTAAAVASVNGDTRPRLLPWAAPVAAMSVAAAVSVLCARVVDGPARPPETAPVLTLFQAEAAVLRTAR